MKKISINFKIHQPYRLKRYRFFDIGKDHLYADNDLNNAIIKQVTDSCYSKLFTTMLDLIDHYSNKIKFGVSISGVALRQIKEECPQTYFTMRALAQSGNVEFISQTYAASISSLYDHKEFARQASHHREFVKECFGINTSDCFCNTSLIFSNEIASRLVDMGYKSAMIESRPDIMRWRNPNFIYASADSPSLKLVVRNEQLSRLLEYNPEGSSPETQAEELISNLHLHHGDVNILYINSLEFAGEEMSDDAIAYLSAIFKKLADSDSFELSSIDSATNPVEARDSFDVPQPISYGDTDKDISTWIGNDLQREALEKLYLIGDKMREVNDENLFMAWELLQSSDHSLYMSTKEGNTMRHYSPYSSIYEAFINFMNVLSDISLTADRALEARCK